MGSLSLTLLIVGSLATGATRHRVYSGFRSRLGGRIVTGFVNMEKKLLFPYINLFLFFLIVYICCLYNFTCLAIYYDHYDGAMYWSVYFRISL